MKRPMSDLKALFEHMREKKLEGMTLIDIEYFKKEGPSSGGEEILLDFGGPEILIYVHQTEGIKVEVD